MTRSALLLALAALTLAACDANDPTLDLLLPDTDDSSEPSDALDLLPLAVGNRWITDFIQTDGTVTETTADTLTVVRDTVIAGERWAEVEGSRDRRSIPAGWYTNRESGVWKWLDVEEDEPYLLYAYPADEGDTYTLPGRSNFTVTVADTAVPVEISSGTFSGILYELDTDEAYGYPVSDGEGRLDRILIPGRGFAFIGCAYLGQPGDGGLVVTKRLDWHVRSFEPAR